MATPNLNLDHITGSQTNKEVTANEAFDGLDKAMNTTLAITITGNRTLTSAEFRENSTFKLVGSPSSAFALVVPGIHRVFGVINLTGKICTVEADGTGGVTLSNGEGGLFASDGADVYLVSSGQSGGSDPVPYDMAAFVAEKPVDDEIVFRFVAPRAVTIPASFTGSQAKAAVASTGDVSFSIQKNSTPICFVRFNISATGTFGVIGGGGAQSLVAGDVLTIHAPEYQDATLYDIAITLLATVD